MKYMCNCGNISKIGFTTFKAGHRCSVCGSKKRIEKTKHIFEYVYNCFKEQGCELLEQEYVNSSIKMKYRCSCGNVSEIVFGSFRKGTRCAKCGGCEKHTFDYVKQYFLDNNCKLLENKYINEKYKMKYICKCGNINYTSFNNFKTGRRCKQCAGLEKHTFKYVKQYFLDNNCKLLEIDYKNIDTSMRYQCDCGTISKITFYHFKNGQRCKKCSIKKRSGENHCNYNPNLTDEDREANKSRTNNFLYQRWRKKVYKRDNYICQKCNNKGGQLNAHHIESWASNKKIRLSKSNGITFCEKHHKQFHKKYGKINNNRQQLNEFLKTTVLGT